VSLSTQEKENPHSPGDPQMMHRPPYVPKLHSSQILTSVSGRTYESHTGLKGGGGFSSADRSSLKEFFFMGEKVDGSPFSVAFLTEAANG
jgi:hypothetical protein